MGPLLIPIEGQDYHAEFSGQFCFLSKPGWSGRYALRRGPGGWACDCPDAHFRRRPTGCKHALALLEYTMATEVAKPPDLAALAAALKAPFDPRELKWKPQHVSGARALVVAYVNARAVQDRLDEVLGVLGWQDEYLVLPDGAVVCRLELRVGDLVVARTDVGYQSEQPDDGDKMKAAFSDALKRAAVKFGVGRYLYRLEPQWVDYDPQKKKITGTPRLPASPQGGSEPPVSWPRQPATPPQRDRIDRLQLDLGMPNETLAERVHAAVGRRDPDRFTANEAALVIERMEAALAARGQGVRQ